MTQNGTLRRTRGPSRVLRLAATCCSGLLFSAAACCIVLLFSAGGVPHATAAPPANAGNPGENGLGRINQGFLEQSNVNVVEEMVNMIVAQRAYEVNSRAVRVADDMLSQINNLVR